MTRLKDVAVLIAGQSPASDQVEPLTDGIPFVQGNAEFGPEHPEPRLQCDRPPKKAQAGDILLSVRAPVGALNTAVGKLGIGRGLCAIRPTDVHHRFLWWWLHHARKELDSLATGSTFASVSTSTVAGLVLSGVDQRSQVEIADYLDRETAQIDTLIAKQEQLIDRLRERRSAVVTSAVTGADAAAIVKVDTPYLDWVPSGWLLEKFGRSTSVRSGLVDPRDEPWCDAVLVAPNHIEANTGRLLAQETASEQGADSGKYRARRGDILYSKIRPTLNKVAIAVEDCLCSADMYAIVSTAGDDHRFIAHYMRSQPFHAYATELSTRVKMPKINQEELAAAPLLRPPLDEQRRIVAYLDEQTAKIDALIAKAERFIELAKERRAALITAAVTGQLDVTAA